MLIGKDGHAIELTDLHKVEKVHHPKDPEKLVIDAMIASYFKNIDRLISGTIIKKSDRTPLVQLSHVWAFKSRLIYIIMKDIADLLKDNIMDHLRQNDSKFDMLFFTQKTHVNIAMLLRDMPEAIKVLRILKSDCANLMKLKHKMHVYHQLGYCYSITKQLEKAIESFKKMLQIAWYENDESCEKEAYHHLSYSYFTLGQIEKSNYYRDRVARGTIDN